MSATMTISAEAHSARYGPMESVLLFHNLVEAGAVSVESLQAAAAILMNNPLVDASRDRERFEPDALRQHVFHVIDDDSAASVDPALLHRATVKLYERYRKAVVASIREDEEQYFQKQEEIAEIKNGLCDERLLREYREGTMTSSRNASERGDTSPEKREHSSAQGTASPPPQADVVTPPTALIAAAAEPTATDETPRSSPTTPVSVAAPKEGKSVESARVTDLPLVGPRRPKTPQTPAVPATKPSPSVKAPPRLPVPPSPPTVTLPAAVSPPTAVALQTTKTRLSALAQVASVLPLLTEVSVGPSRQQSNGENILHCCKLCIYYTDIYRVQSCRRKRNPTQQRGISTNRVQLHPRCRHLQLSTLKPENPVYHSFRSLQLGGRRKPDRNNKKNWSVRGNRRRRNAGDKRGMRNAGDHRHHYHPFHIHEQLRPPHRPRLRYASGRKLQSCRSRRSRSRPRREGHNAPRLVRRHALGADSHNRCRLRIQAHRLANPPPPSLVRDLREVLLLAPRPLVPRDSPPYTLWPHPHQVPLLV